jgi:arylsulfatase
MEKRDARVEQTEPVFFSADETCGVGNEAGSPVTSDYETRKFNGKVSWVEIELGKGAKEVDHMIKLEERLRLAMATQ